MEPVFPIALDLPQQRGHRRAALHAALKRAIVEGRLPAGFLLPSSRQAAEALGTARSTVVHAYDLLVAEGYVQPRENARFVVALPAGGDRRPRAGASVASPGLALSRRWRETWPAFPGPGELPVDNFRLGVPDHRYFPHSVWRRIEAAVQRRWSRRPFVYPPHEGLPELREAIAAHVAFSRGIACSPSQVLVTSGAQQAFHLLATLLVEPARTTVAVESPGYPPMQQAFLAASARLRHVAVDDDGLHVERLPGNARVVCVTPSHQSPTGAAMSLPRRMALLEFARRHSAAIVEDDYDGEYRYTRRPLDALQTLDRDGRVFYVGTFSKSLFPSLRMGFVISPPWACEALATIKRIADAHGNDVLQATLAIFIREGHLARHIRRMTALYGARREAILEQFAGPLRSWFEPVPSIAGMHLCARLRDPSEAERLLPVALREAPGATTVSLYSHAPETFPALALGFGCIEAVIARQHLRRLASRLGGRSRRD